MSDTDRWINIKRAFGARMRRDNKAQTLVGEVRVQADMLQGLGLQAESQAMQVQHGAVTQTLQNARTVGDTTQGYRDLGTVKAQARTAMRAPVDQDAAAGMLRAIPKILDSIDDTLGYDTPRHAKRDNRLQNLRNELAQVNAATSKEEVARLEKEARALLNDAVKNTRDIDGSVRSGIAPKAYADMLKERYGITATPPFGKGLDRFYDALSLLPATHVAQSSLSEVEILNDTRKTASLGDYSAMGTKIRVNLGKVRKHPTMEYKIGGTTSSVNTFNVTTLHEVGHSVDDKAGVMANPAGQNFGGWNGTALSVDDVVTAYWTSIAGAVGGAHQAAVEAELKKALQGQAHTQPPSVPAQAWRAALPALETCKAIAADKKPWLKARAVNGVCYFQDKGTWRSYSEAARNALTVRPYQWRSPAEWFAEIYAASWIMKKTPAGNVDPRAAMYMYRGA